MEFAQQLEKVSDKIKRLIKILNEADDVDFRGFASNQSKVSRPDAGDVTVRESIVTSREPQQPSTSMSESTPANEISEKRLRMFKKGLAKIFRQTRDSSLAVTSVVKYVNENSGKSALTNGEIIAALDQMQNENQIMVVNGLVYLI